VVRALSSAPGGVISWLRLLPLLLLVADAARAGLVLADLPEVEADGARREGVGLRAASVLLEGGAEAAHQRVEAAPRLAQRAGARRGRARVAEEGTRRRVDLGLAELVQVPQELQHVRAAALRQAQRRPVVPQVLPERVPVPPLLRLVPARRLRRAAARRRRRRPAARSTGSASSAAITTASRALGVWGQVHRLTCWHPGIIYRHMKD
jgi:chromatin segregation and condensation protein Rec8/ScpA/Scc1 (kleisin family)